MNTTSTIMLCKVTIKNIRKNILNECTSPWKCITNGKTILVKLNLPNAMNFNLWCRKLDNENAKTELEPESRCYNFDSKTSKVKSKNNR